VTTPAPSPASPRSDRPQHGDGLVTGLASRGRRHANDAEVGHPRTLSPLLILLLTHGGLAITFCLTMYWVFAREWSYERAVAPWLTQAGRNLTSVHDFTQSYGWLVLVAVALLLALDVWTYARIRKRSSPVAARVWFWGVAALLVVMLCAGPVMLHRHLNPQRPIPSSGALKP
jgi:magnesium-transporting ATPase (P-type)